MSSKYHIRIGSFNLEYFFPGATSQQLALNIIRNKLVEAINEVSSLSLNHAAVATRMISNTPEFCNLTDSGSGSYVNKLVLSYENFCHTLYVYSSDGVVKLWSGSISIFNSDKHIAGVKLDSSLAGKLVRFTYSGGSTPNSVRVVKVKEYQDGHLQGTDLVKNQHRQFKAPLISKLELVTL